MGITFHYVEGSNAALRETLLGWWNRDWSTETAERYFGWRYRERPNGETLLAYDRERCVAVIDSFVRPYLIDGRRVAVRETCDWFCLPEYRMLGVGLQLMRRMMARPEPILVVGGSDFTLELLPRLRWSRLHDVVDFVLPISLRVTAEAALPVSRPGANLISRVVPNLPLTLPSPRLPSPSPDAEIRQRRLHENVPFEADGVHTLTPILEPDTLDWLARAPSATCDIHELSFYCDGQLAGISICRLRAISSGTIASIVHLHAARAEFIDWVLSGTVRHLRERGVGVIRCRSSSPRLCNALRRLRFLRHRPIPTYWWAADGSMPEGPIHLTWLRADDGLQQ